MRKKTVGILTMKEEKTPIRMIRLFQTGSFSKSEPDS